MIFTNARNSTRRSLAESDVAVFIFLASRARAILVSKLFATFNPPIRGRDRNHIEHHRGRVSIEMNIRG